MEGGEKRVPHLGLFLLSLVVGASVWLLAGPLDLAQRMTAALFAATVVLWITEAVPLAVTSFLGTTLLVATGTMSAGAAFGVFGDPIILLFIGSFILARAMEESRLDKRIAYFILARRWATRSASALLFWLGTIACVISLFVSNTATTAMLLPIGLTILKALRHDQTESRVAWSYMLMLTWGSSIAVGTIVGTPPNVIGVGLIREATGVSINFVQWGLFAMPITALMLVIAWFALSRWGGEAAPDSAAAHEAAKSELARLGPFRGAERATMGAFFLTLFLWMLPGTLEYVLGADSLTARLAMERVPESVAALAGAILLFLLPCRDTPSRRAITWDQAVRIDWGTVILFAGGLALGKAAFETGLAARLGHSMAALMGVSDVWAITALAIFLAILLSELASNTASATTLVPVVIALAEGAGVNPIPPALGAIIGANLGFMLPVSTAPNAIVYSSGLLPARVLMRTGLLFDVVGFAVTWTCLRLMLPPLGLA